MTKALLIAGVATLALAATATAGPNKAGRMNHKPPAQPIPYSQLDAFLTGSAKERAAIEAQASTGMAANTAATAPAAPAAPEAAASSSTSASAAASGDTAVNPPGGVTSGAATPPAAGGIPAPEASPDAAAATVSGADPATPSSPPAK